MELPQNLDGWKRLLTNEEYLEAWTNSTVIVAIRNSSADRYPNSAVLNGFADFLGVPLEWQWNQARNTWRAELSLANVTVETPGQTPKTTTNNNVPQSAASPAIVLRASSSIWSYTESEGNVEAGQERPYIVFDEETFHLAATTRIISNDDLLKRAKEIIKLQGVPVEIEARNVRWIKDGAETRSRVIASLKNHRFSDIKAIMGIDYMGEWANLQMQFAFQPPTLPPQDTTQLYPPVNFSGLIGAIGVIVGLIMCFSGGSGENMIMGIIIMGAGILGAVIANSMYASSNRRYLEEKAMRERKREAEIRARENAASSAFAMRTFKIDDMRLFCTSMRTVFKAVVDDVLQYGGNIVHVEGGQNRFIGDPDAGSDAAAVTENAANVEV